MRRLGEHDIATCERMVSRRIFAGRKEAEVWIARTDGRNYIHQVRPVGSSPAGDRYEVKYCLREAAPPRVYRRH